jgi:D-arginine dehydrogenase
MNRAPDFLVVGGGMAGVACAAELASHGSVLLLERESSLAYHTTGRSAAISMESYGNTLIRQLTCASRSFFEHPPVDVTDEALISPRGALIVADEANFIKLKTRYQSVVQQVPSAAWMDQRELQTMVPFLGSQWVAGIYESSAFDLDVHAIHTAFVRQLRQRGGQIHTEREIVSAKRQDGQWEVRLSDGSTLWCLHIINAAGAWADEVAQRCGSKALGIQALQRTVVVVNPGCDVSHIPYVGTVDEQIFMKPDVGRLMVSPCDETPSVPCDTLPDELGVAIAMDRLEQATTLRPQRVLNRWAGLRVFVPDRSPLIGPDPHQPGLHWCAALGGYGIQTAPAVGALCAAQVTGTALSAEMAQLPVKLAAPERTFSANQSAVVPVADLG